MDFYAGNLHKWALVPRGRGILWVKPEHRHDIKKFHANPVNQLNYFGHRKFVEPTVTSHYYGSDEFNMMFFTQVTIG